MYVQREQADEPLGKDWCVEEKALVYSQRAAVHLSGTRSSLWCPYWKTETGKGPRGGSPADDVDKNVRGNKLMMKAYTRANQRKYTHTSAK